MIKEFEKLEKDEQEFKIREEEIKAKKKEMEQKKLKKEKALKSLKSKDIFKNNGLSVSTSELENLDKQISQQIEKLQQVVNEKKSEFFESIKNE